MSGLCARTYVTVPAPPPARFGLIDSAVPLDAGDRALCGIDWEPLRCDPALPYPAPCPDPPATKTAIRGTPLVEVDPFVVYSAYQCSLPSRDDPAIRARLSAELQRGEGRAAELAFWSGSAAGQALGQGLANAALDADAVILGNGACLSPCGALAALEDFLGSCYGGEGYIHAPRGALQSLSRDANYITRDGNRLRTLSGAVVVAGGGYTGNGPDGNPPPDGCIWVFATGTVYLWRGPIDYTAGDVSQYADLARNDAVLIAERSMLVTYDCCKAGVLLDVSCC